MWMVHAPCCRPVWRLGKGEDARYYERPSFGDLKRIELCPGCNSSLRDAARNGKLWELIEVDRPVPTPL